MKLPLLILLTLLTMLLSAQNVVKPSYTIREIPPIFCPASDEPSNHFVPKSNRKSYNKTNTTFNVAYLGAVPAQAKTAFENGVLEYVRENFQTDIPINILVNWDQLDGNALAGAAPTAWYAGFTNVPNPEEVYPIALAEKISRSNLNGIEDADIVITINSSVDWYYDFENPQNVNGKFDFFSTLLHEVFHGLGFSARVFVDESNNTGIYNGFADNTHSILAHEIQLGTSYLRDLPDLTTEMADAFVSQNLFWSRNQESTRHKLSAPPVFNVQSSVSHLDESTYNGTIDALMTPSSSAGEIERDAGIALDMLYDIGWDMTYLIHEPSVGSENLEEDYIVSVDIISDSEFNPEDAKLVYSNDRFVSDIRELPLTLMPSGKYEAQLDAIGEDVIYSYYVTVTNVREIEFTNPGQAPSNHFTYRIAIDDNPPSIAHRSQRLVNNVDPSVLISATIVDQFLGVESAYIEWSLNGIPQERVIMNPKEEFGGGFSDVIYEGSLVYPDGPLSKEDIINYNIIAVDKSLAKNEGVAPTNAEFYILEVTETALPVASYSNDFSTATDDLEGQFQESTPSGFSNAAIHSPHPYTNAGEGNFLNFIHELNIPIIVQEENATIEFDEIVIVEPGDPGTVFGQDEFWDYVIVEGKKSGGSDWKPFLNGYDASENSTWLSTYNAQSNGNSTMFEPRVIDMLASGDFQPGDIIFIRFRLFSDPFATGWGWAIDNLKIQELSTAVEDFVVQQNISIHPNPSGDFLDVELELIESPDRLQLSIKDVSGRTFKNIQVPQRGVSISERIDIGDLIEGMYIVEISFNNKDRLLRKFVKK